MKVFLETHNLNNPYSGFGQFNYNLIKAFHELNDPNFKFVVHTRNIEKLRSEFGRYFGYKRSFGFRRYNWGRIRGRYDLWHSLNQNTKIEPRQDLPYVLTIHDINFVDEISGDMNHPRNQRFLEKLRRADAITYISEYAKRSTHQFFDIPDVPEYVIYNGNPVTEHFDTSGFMMDDRINAPYFFSIGDFHERKNFHLLVELMVHFPSHQLVIAGNDTRDYGVKVKESIRRAGLEDRVVLVGRVNDLAKQYYFEHCEALLFPSLREGFGLPPIEAMAFGKPVFLANTTSLPEIGGDVAFYFRSFEPQQMAEDIRSGMQRFANDKELMESTLRERGARFNWIQTAQEYLAVYKQVLNMAD
jgi:glycosyltransferase involved in cell wall biosynthesis